MTRTLRRSSSFVDGDMQEKQPRKLAATGLMREHGTTVKYEDLFYREPMRKKAM